MHTTTQNHQEIYPRLQKRINYLSVAKVILSRWYWALFALIFGFLVAYAYLAYTPPLYASSALLKFEEKKSEISELINVRNIYDRTNKVESEKSVIRSRTVIEKALRSLDYEVSFYASKSFYSTELYPFKPLKIRLLDKSRAYLFKNFEFNALGDANYQLCFTYQDKRFCKEYKDKQNVSLPGLKFSISLGSKIKKGTSYIFRFNDQTELYDKINKSLKFDESQNSSLVYLKITDNNQFFATDILNSIIKEYLNFDKRQRSVTASQTASFISSLLQTMADTVKNSGLAIQQFKQNNPSLTITDNLNLLTSRLTDLQTERHTLDIEHIMISSIEKALNVKSSDQLTYNQPGITDMLLNNLLLKYNELIVNRKLLLQTYTENSARVKQLDQQIADLRIAINENISSQREHNNKKSVFLLKQTDSINLSLANLPKTEREFINLQARFDINQKVYSYLAEKKLEAEISRAAVTPGAVIIDKATYPRKAISPVPKNIYLFSAILSFISGLALIYAARIFNPYIYNKNTIEEYSKTPVIGIIRKYHGDILSKHSAFTVDPRSLFSESVRTVRSNLSFFASEKNSKIICITSEISGEGKSFVSSNLAISLTLTEKKVLLIAADLRKSRLHDNFNINNLSGLSKFLSGQVTAKEIIIQTEIKNLDLITSGPVPPNPSELLHSEKMQHLLDDLKGKYDFILIDSAPIGLVTDGKPLLKMADITLFIIRSGISKRHFATTPDQLKMELALSNIAIILNDYVDSNFHNHYYSHRPLNMPGRPYYYSDPYHYNNPDYLEL